MKIKCKNCIAFDDFAEFCRLSNNITFDYIHFSKDGINSKYKEFRPVEKCEKPKSKKHFFDIYGKKDSKC